MIYQSMGSFKLISKMCNFRCFSWIFLELWRFQRWNEPIFSKYQFWPHFSLEIVITRNTFRIIIWTYIFFTSIQGGFRQKFVEPMPKIWCRWYLAPTHQFFSINHRFFSSAFSGPTNFFPRLQFFPLNFGNLPTFLRKIHIFQIFDPLISRTLSVLGSLFSDSCFF